MDLSIPVAHDQGAANIFPTTDRTMPFALSWFCVPLEKLLLVGPQALSLPSHPILKIVSGIW